MSEPGPQRRPDLMGGQGDPTDMLGGGEPLGESPDVMKSGPQPPSDVMAGGREPAEEDSDVMRGGRERAGTDPDVMAPPDE